MVKPIGPTVPRWQLGDQLNQLRRAAKLDPEDVAEILDCSASKIRKIEAGYVGTSRGELILVLDAYGVPTEDRNPYLELAALGRKRGWWSKFGKLSTPFTNFLGLESAAVSVQAFEPLTVYGLFQTDEYAEALIRATLQPNAPEVERQMAIRKQRKAQVLDTDPPEIWVVLDESVLHRIIGSRSIARQQMEHLIELEERSIGTIQVLTFDADPNPGTLGAFWIFEFPENLHTPIAHVESQAGNLSMEDEVDMQRCSLGFQRICAAARGPAESIKLIKAAARRLAN